MAMMGSSIDPRMFVNDYSGFTNAAAIQAAGMLDFGNQIGGAIKDYQKEQKDSKNALKAGEAQIKAAAALFPSQAPMFESLANDLRNEDTPLSERAAIASQVADLISMSVGEKRYQTELGYKNREYAMREEQNKLQNRNYDQQYSATGLEIERQKAADENKRQMGAAQAPAYLELLKTLNKEQNLLSPGVIAGYESITDPATRAEAIGNAMKLFGGGEGAGELREIPNSDGSFTTYQKTKNGWVPFQAPGGASIGKAFTLSGAKATKYGYEGDTTPDRNSSARIGAFVPKSEQDKILAGEESVYKLRDNDFALSPDMEQAFRAQGISPGETVVVQMENGDEVQGRWMDRTAQDDQIAAGKIPGVDKPLRGRVDFYTPGGVNPYDGMGIKSVAKVEMVQAGQKPAPNATPSLTDEIAVAKYNDEKKATEAKAGTLVEEAEGFSSTLKELATHPGFTNLFGSNIGVPTWWPGSAGADAKAILGKVQGKAFLEAIQKMKGMGALSEKEGQTATKAYSALDPNMSELAAAKEIKSLKDQLDIGIARQKSGTLVNPDGTPKAAPDPMTVTANRLGGMIQPK